MFATEECARKLAAARLIDLVAAELMDAAEMRQSVEVLLHSKATGPGGLALLEGEDVAVAIMMVRRMALDAEEAVRNLHAAAQLLRDDD